MGKGKKTNTVTTCTELAQPLAEQMGLSLWDVVFEKEGSSWYLRYYIDKEGGVDINDCENFSRAVSDLLDQTDPIEQSYCLEVSSPGLERKLVKDAHFVQFSGYLVDVRMVRPVDGIRDFIGELESFAEDKITLVLEDGTKKELVKSETAYVKLYIDFTGGQEE